MPFLVKHENAYNKNDFQRYFKKYKNICTNKKLQIKMLRIYIKLDFI